MAAAGTPDRLAPVTHDHDSAGFWEAAARRQLVARVCTACGTTLHLPRGWPWAHSFELALARLRCIPYAT